MSEVKPIAIGIYTDENDRVHYERVPEEDPYSDRELQRYFPQTLVSPVGSYLSFSRVRQYQCVIIGLEDARGRFEIYKETGQGLNPLIEQFPSIRLTDDRASYKFGDENEYFLFRMLWENK